MNRSPEEYVKAAFLARETGEEMLSRLEWMTIQPKVVLDVGSGTGEMSAALAKRYPEAVVLSLDNDEAMLTYAKIHTGARACVQAEAASLPLPNQSVDMLIAHFLLPWLENWESLWREWRRVLRPNGVMLLSAFGPDTLREASSTAEARVPLLIDMHDFGDKLLKEGFVEPVVEANHYIIRYHEKKRLREELNAIGLETVTIDDITSEGTPPAWQVTYEVIQAHAFAPAVSGVFPMQSDGSVRVPVSAVRRR